MVPVILTVVANAKTNLFVVSPSKKYKNIFTVVGKWIKMALSELSAF